MTDVYLAAAAIERDAVWASFDRGFARFQALRWINPKTFRAESSEALKAQKYTSTLPRPLVLSQFWASM